MNRREALKQIAGLAAGSGAATVVSLPVPVPAAESSPAPETFPDYPPRENEHPAIVRVLLGYYDALDALDEALSGHEIDRAGTCSCDYCVEARGQFYTLQLYVACLEGITHWSSERHDRENAYRQNVKDRQRTVRQAVLAAENEEEEPS